MKVLLDTNVLSELLRLNPESTVLTWFASNGKRRAALESAVGAMFNEDFSGRVLPFDSAAAFAYVDIVVTRRARGQPISQFDAQIAAIAKHHAARLATRNVGDFEGCGLALVNPWSKSG